MTNRGPDGRIVEIRTAAAAATQLLKKRENGFGATGGDAAAPRSKTKLPGQRSGATRVADRIELKLCYHVRNGGEETELLDCIAIVPKEYIYT
jgi:hypothetical protein